MINCPWLYISFSEGNPQKKSSTPFFSGLESVSKLTTSPPSKPKGVTWVGCWKMTGKTWMTQLQGFELSWVLASAKPQVNTRILRLYADRYISRTLCLFGKKTLKQSMFVLYDGPFFFSPKVTLSEIRWSICSCQKFRWVVRSEEAPSHEVRAPVTWMNFSCWEKAGCQRAKKKKAKETA